MIYSHEVEKMCTVAQGVKGPVAPLRFRKKQNGYGLSRSLTSLV